jgi:hypothetical protein
LGLLVATSDCAASSVGSARRWTSSASACMRAELFFTAPMMAIRIPICTTRAMPISTSKIVSRVSMIVRR